MTKSCKKKNSSASTVTKIWSSNSVMKLHSTFGLSPFSLGTWVVCKCSVFRCSWRLGSAKITSLLWFKSASFWVLLVLPLPLSIELVPSDFSLSEDGNLSTSAGKDDFKKCRFFLKLTQFTHIVYLFSKCLINRGNPKSTE